jgi:hypothetical protein
MLTPEEVRKLCPELSGFSDAELEQIRLITHLVLTHWIVPDRFEEEDSRSLTESEEVQ